MLYSRGVAENKNTYCTLLHYCPTSTVQPTLRFFFPPYICISPNPCTAFFLGYMKDPICKTWELNLTF